MDNASYHSVQINKAPTSSSNKLSMQTWLKQNNIYFDPKATKPVLYSIIKLKKDGLKKYEIDTIAELHGHTVVRQPPYYCQFNAIELIWAQIKDYVAKHNIFFKASCVKTLFETALSTVSAENWKNACDHVENCERFYWERDGLLDELTDKFIINVEDSDTESDVSDDETDGNHEQDMAADASSEHLDGIFPLPPSP
ncbi:hypothetical protein C0J52_14752 [Blattella germanica]|nr:hypothetical protein C0J52_14752 [Blattella germanica]